LFGLSSVKLDKDHAVEHQKMSEKLAKDHAMEHQKMSENLASEIL
jgi:hypothetical protein